MQIRYRNQVSYRFTGYATVLQIINRIIKMQALGWNLDTCLHDQGVSIDLDGIEIYFVKISNTVEPAPRIFGERTD